MELPRDTEERIVETIEEMTDDLVFLAEKRDLSWEAYSTDRTENYAVKRAFQNVTNAVIDIAGMVLSAIDETDEDMPATNRGKIERLADVTGIGAAISAELGKSAGFRNLLAHQYGTTIDDEIIFEALQEELWIFRDFIADVRDAVAEE